MSEQTVSEPISFSEQLRAWRRRKQVRPAAIAPDSTEPSGNLVPFRRRAAAGSPDRSTADTPWLDWLRADPWVPVVED